MKLFATKEDKQKLVYFLVCIGQLGKILDELGWTPLRDIQVFANKTYKSFSGLNHPVLTASLIASGIMSCLPYLAKVFNKNESDTLQEVLDHCDKELGIRFENPEKLTDRFQAELNQKDFPFLQAKIQQKKKGFIRKKLIWDLSYQFSDEIKEIILGSGVLTADALAQDNQLDPKVKDFLLNLFLPGKTLAESRQAFLSRFEEMKKSDIAELSWETACDVAFQYWIAYFAINMLYSNDDATKWSVSSQFAAIIFALGMAAVKLVSKAITHLKNRFKFKKMEDDIKEGKKLEIKFVNKSLKKQQLLSFYAEQLELSNELKLAQASYRYTGTKSIQDALNKAPRKKSFLKRFKNQFFSIVKSVPEYQEIIEEQIGEGKSFSRRIASVNTAVGFGIGAAFVEWFLTATISAFSLIGKATSAVADFLDGLGGGIIGIVGFALGTVVGAVYYNKKVKPRLEAEKIALRAKYEDKKDDIQKLAALEIENKKLRQLLKNEGVDLLPTLKPYDDRGYRRITVEKTKGFTLAKKTINRASTFIGKMGTGVLLFRFLPLAIAACAGISLATAISAFFWPLTITALVVGVIWASLFVYQYIQERRLESAKRFLDRVDISLKIAETHNAELRQQFQPNEAPREIFQAASENLIAEGSSNSDFAELPTTSTSENERSPDPIKPNSQNTAGLFAHPLSQSDANHSMDSRLQISSSPS